MQNILSRSAGCDGVGATLAAAAACRRLPPLPPAACCCPHAGPPLAFLCCPPHPLAALAFLVVDLFFCRGPVRGPLLRLFSQSGQSKEGQRRFLSQVGSGDGLCCPATLDRLLLPTTCALLLELPWRLRMAGYCILRMLCEMPIVHAAQRLASLKYSLLDAALSTRPRGELTVTHACPAPQLAAKLIGIVFLSAIMPLVRCCFWEAVACARWHLVPRRSCLYLAAAVWKRCSQACLLYCNLAAEGGSSKRRSHASSFALLQAFQALADPALADGPRFTATTPVSWRMVEIGSGYFLYDVSCMARFCGRGWGAAFMRAGCERLGAQPKNACKAWQGLSAVLTPTHPCRSWSAC